VKNICGNTSIVYEAPLREEPSQRRISGLTIPALANYVLVETLRGTTSVYYQRRAAGEGLSMGLSSEHFEDTLQEAIIDTLIKQNPGYGTDLR
jgi:hypothetical protein